MMHLTQLMVFMARAEARALLVYAGIYDPEVCFDVLLDDAFYSGLLDRVGVIVLIAIIERARDRYEKSEA